MGSPRPLTKKQVLDVIARGSGLVEADLRTIDLSGVCFDGADMTRAKLAECNLSRSTFRGTNLTQASMWHADCKDACFDEAILDECDMDFTYLEGATFRGARIRKTIFPFARVSLEQVQASVKTGKKLKMEHGTRDD